MQQSISSNDSEANNIISEYDILKLEGLNLESNYEESTNFDDEDHGFMNIEGQTQNN